MCIDVPAQRAVAGRDLQGPFNYFNGARAAYIAAGEQFTAAKSTSILFPSAYVLSGDTAGIQNDSGELTFDPLDADKDDYVQDCVGGAADVSDTQYWQIHACRQNALLADGHPEMVSKL